mmetsp:Transcript_18972/g.47422  ORF Transcript_18972/g.47422 Transcript_18972/m.47422 type:complete len:369 (-) Transcript_18972:365-1471(-)|eukprot:CAMPEP_0178994140 /NCGR_PEP_ID=MMETSP0795-20121207/7108_1 /TAXON_ID=88552 /ORGANISM="Amoebophrya sp., Strain Ameob2" /LENGTH=368 /DNA_ID=CAMNT_0020686307 /DNA_START=356 /DNA_END=1462 /DNA_ORIENTATION=-
MEAVDIGTPAADEVPAPPAPSASSDSLKSNESLTKTTQATEADPAEQSPVASPNAVYASASLEIRGEESHITTQPSFLPAPQKVPVAGPPKPAVVPPISTFPAPAAQQQSHQPQPPAAPRQQQAPASGGPPPEQYARRSGPPSARSINPSSISNAAPPAPASIPAPVPAGAADNSNSNDYYHRLHAQYGAAAVTDYSGAGVYSGMAGGGSMEEPLLQDPSLAQNRARLRERRQHAGLFSSHLYDRDGNYVGVHSDPSLLHQGSDPGVYNGTTSAARGASSLNSARGGGGGRYGSTSKGPRRKKTMLEYLLRKMQKPEVILLSVWWLIMFSLLLFLADLWSLLVLIWKPLLFLIAVPVICFTVVLVVTL